MRKRLSCEDMCPGHEEIGMDACQGCAGERYIMSTKTRTKQERSQNDEIN